MDPRERRTSTGLERETALPRSAFERSRPLLPSSPSLLLSLSLSFRLCPLAQQCFPPPL